MRRFKLINCNGEVYDLNDIDFFLYNPSGLGYKRNIEYKKVGNTFIPYNDSVDQPSPTGVLRFKGSHAYDKYYDFVRFATKEPLRLEYSPSDKIYNLDCYISSIEKSELNANGLHCKLYFAALGYYYSLYVMEAGTDITDGKIYDYTYPYKYADTAAGTVALDVDSSMDSPIKISIYGPTDNPSWSHYVNNRFYETGKCNASIPAGHRLVIDTTQTPFSITEQDYQGNIYTDRYVDSDITTERFFFLENGRNRISVAHDGASIPKLKVEAKILYETV